MDELYYPKVLTALLIVAICTGLFLAGLIIGLIKIRGKKKIMVMDKYILTPSDKKELKQLKKEKIKKKKKKKKK